MTVTGETPIVDVQSVSRQTTMDNGADQRHPGCAFDVALDADAEHGRPGRCGVERAGRCRTWSLRRCRWTRSNEGRLQVDGLSVHRVQCAGVSATRGREERAGRSARRRQAAWVSRRPAVRCSTWCPRKVATGSAASSTPRSGDQGHDEQQRHRRTREADVTTAGGLHQRWTTTAPLSAAPSRGSHLVVPSSVETRATKRTSGHVRPKLRSGCPGSRPALPDRRPCGVAKFQTSAQALDGAVRTRRRRSRGSGTSRRRAKAPALTARPGGLPYIQTGSRSSREAPRRRPSARATAAPGERQRIVTSASACSRPAGPTAYQSPPARRQLRHVRVAGAGNRCRGPIPVTRVTDQCTRRAPARRGQPVRARHREPELPRDELGQ